MVYFTLEKQNQQSLSVFLKYFSFMFSALKPISYKYIDVSVQINL